MRSLPRESETEALPRLFPPKGFSIKRADMVLSHPFFVKKVGFLLDIPDKHPASPKSAAENLWIIHKLVTSGEMGMIAAALEILFL